MPRATFDSDEPWAWWLPNREWAVALVEGADNYWRLVLNDYRERVRQGGGDFRRATRNAVGWSGQPARVPAAAPIDQHHRAEDLR